MVGKGLGGAMVTVREPLPGGSGLEVHLGKAEIEDFHGAVEPDENDARFGVAVADALFVGGFEGEAFVENFFRCF